MGTQHEHVTQATRVCIIGKYRLAIVASLKREEIVLLSGSHPGLFSTVAVALKSDGRIAGVRRDAGLLLDSDLDGLGDLLTAVVGSGGPLYSIFNISITEFFVTFCDNVEELQNLRVPDSPGAGFRILQK